MEHTATLPHAVASAADDAVVDVGTLFVLHGPFLMRVVERLTGPGPHVEDLVQDVFIVAHRRRRELRDGSELRGWLYRVTANKAMQHRRSLWRRFRLSRAVEVEPPGARPAIPDEIVAQREHGQRIRQAVLELPFLQREAFVLFELEGLDTKAVAALLDVPEGTVSSRLSAARRLFRERWTRSERAAQGPR
ncbi:MAG: sigma-70 family RNA polymerase sigma factor [Deltaproteobacteria bacterium]|nr:sigma-70 family RNA polymerase sigma factor [Deltaproteobacteria bacterium]